MKKPKIIVITGTPATGKTTLAKQIAKKERATHLEVNELIKKEHLFHTYDRSLRTRLVDIEKIIARLIQIVKEYRKRKESLVIDSHLAHHLPPKYVDQCIVTKCGLNTLKKRLEKRNYPKKKVRENLDAEIFDVCLMEAIENRHRKIKIVDTTKK
ncbi:MAG: AAA family ATPase [Nanoarchaeota archaeon]